MNSNTCTCKVGRVATEYELTNLDERLVRRRNNEDASLRELKAYISKEVLKRSMEHAGLQATDTKADHYLALLRDEDGVEHSEARRELRRKGVDVDAVKEHFVSYQTVRKHLNECLDVDTSDEYTPSPSEDRQRLGELKGRAENVTERTVSRLRDHEVLEIGEPEAIASIKVRCGDCGRTYRALELIRRRTCVCAEEGGDTPPSSTTSAEAREQRSNPSR